MAAVSVATATVPRAFYLDIGGSSSLGYEPTGQLTKDGALLDLPTDHGYADDVVRLEKSTVALDLTKVGCPGETVPSLLGEKDRCYNLPSTQMSIALRYLRAHQSEEGVVSIDIGFNDLQPCIETAAVEVGCVKAGLALVERDLPKVVAKLQAAAGPKVHFVGLEYGDPFLARYIMGTSEYAYAAQTLNVVTELNNRLALVYRTAGFAVTNGAATFESRSTTPTTTSAGVEPRNVAVICAETYMCRSYPFGPDDHANAVGYEAVATQLVAALPHQW